ncbi:MAG TPA: hypothetical protein PLV57_16375 [Phycisphaerae bacterium]|nr:hypothetical protein [Phycisphaerae bacterium]HOM51929.1 hypothetical protein [Phycisphaerae bacterium]HON65822.1 hypothetical protein [Phycisphaerae bacterium]HPP28090.1 hypothetical protein [Phycisphaerae bacterium]HPZ96860.1 hypothetical protein [Phycisphaerae bacterium]
MRRPGLGQSGMDLGYGQVSVQSSPLIPPGRGGLFLGSQFQLMHPRPVPGALARAYDQNVLFHNLASARVARGDSLVSMRYLHLAAGETDSFDDLGFGSDGPAVTAAADPEPVPSTEQSLAELVSNHVTARRRSYVERAWSAFQAGDFQGALRLFSLAENATVSQPEEQATIKLAMAYAAIAAGQSAQAGYFIEWLLTDTSRPGQEGHPEAFNRLFEEMRPFLPNAGSAGVDGRLPTITDMYAGELEQGVSAFKSEDEPRTKALYAVAEWGRGRRANAIFAAERITGEDAGKFARLADILKQAEAMYQGRAVVAEPAATLATDLIALPAPATQPNP